MDAPKPPRRRLRLWQLITGSLLALLIMLVASAFALRASGAAELKRTIADLTARGYPMTVEALRAGVAGGDQMVQDQYDRWSESLVGRGFAKFGNSPTNFSWIDHGAPAPREFLERVAMYAPEFAALRTAIRTGRLHVGCAASLGRLLKDGAGHLVFGFSPDLASLREAAHFLRASALVGDAEAFADLLALVDALSPPRSQLDGSEGAVLTTVMNHTAVELEMLGRLTGPAAEDWLVRSPRLRSQYAEGLRWDTGVTGFLIRDLGHLPTPSSGTAAWFQMKEMDSSVPAVCRDWLFVKADIASTLRIQAGLSERLQGHGPPLVRSSSPSLSVNGAVGAEILVVILDMVMASEAEHRSRHVAVLIRREAIRRGSLPSDNAAVFADKECGTWLEGGESAYWLAYERLSPTRFRIAVDPKRPVPAILSGLPKGPEWFDASKPGAITHSILGQPADMALRLSLKRANTEIVVPDFPPKPVPSVPGLPKPMSPVPVPPKPAPEKR